MDTHNNQQNNCKEDKTLTNMIRDIIFHYIKFYYENELKNRNVEKLPNNDVNLLVNNLYEEKSQHLKQYIRDTLKDNLKQNYPKLQVNMLLLEMFEDSNYAINRVINEIINYQDNK